MPKGSKVEKVYRGVLKKTGDKAQAARIAQAQTGQALKTGRKPKNSR